jgi:amino acid adenylation domain-containing protein
MSRTAEAAPGALFSTGRNVFPHADAAAGRLDEAERRRVLEAWNRTDAPYPRDVCIHQLFQAQAARTPDALAATCEDRSLTYAQLNERANRLAHHLVRLGVGPEVRVGVGLKRGTEMLVALLAVLKAGGAYVPLDPAYPAERLEFTLRDSRVAVLLTEEALRGALPVPDGVRVVSLDEAAAEIARESAANPENGASPRGLAYLIYTSGSTGVPKGVAIEHESAVVLLAWAAELHTAEELGGMLASTSICFDLSVYEIFLPLSLGGRVIVVENALALPHSAAAGEVRLVNTVPSAAAALLRTGGIPAGVTTVNLAGEPLRTELVDALYAHGIHRVYDLYGPSEDTTYSTYTLRRAGAPATIGRPIHNTRAYVLDEGMGPVAAGAPGELYLGGHGLARGYLGRPSLTADRFVPDPFGGEAGGRLYRTGDRVRWTEESASVRECVSAEVDPADSRTDALTHSRTHALEYLGRLDHQVKIRGFRVELGEIESALRRFPGVRDCVVVAREDTPGEKRLAAYLVGAAEPEALRAHLRRTLPEHFVPAAFVTLDEMPLTPNGKLDRKALPAPEMAPDDARYVAPRTPTEAVLAGAWAQLLGLERLGVQDDVFQLGAESLVATRVVARIREVFGVELTVRAVFEAPTVARLAERVEALRGAGRPPLPPIVPLADGRAPRLSFGQEGLWFLDRLRPGLAFYNIPEALRLSGPLDGAALERALGEIVRRHHALRTVFPERDGAPVQVVAPFGGFALPVEDLSLLADDAREAEARRRAADEAARPFDLAAGPLFRARLLRLRAEEHLLLLSIHHAVSDGWSMDVLHRELDALYGAYREGRPSPLPEPRVQFADFAEWQRELAAGDRLDHELAYWRERLAGAPALLELPTDHPRPAVQRHHGAVERMDLSAGLARRLEALGREEGVSLFMVLLAAFQLLLGRYAGTDDVVVGSPIAGRTRPEVEGTIGFFTNTLALRTDLGGDPPFRELLRRVREVTLGAYEHQQVPLELVVELVHPGRSLSHAPLFQVMFVLQTSSGAAPELAGLRTRMCDVEIRSSKLDLTMSFTPGPDGVRGDLEYCTDLFERATVQRMLGHLRRVLMQVADDAEPRLSALELMEDDERARVVEEWNRTAAAYPRTECIHTLFEAQAARTPDATAATHGTESVTYAALNARANRLAHHLVRLGVGPETRVGICQGRGVEMLVSLLAVLKAGGAYVPLDPAYPAERLAFTLRDAHVAVLLTEDALRGLLPAPEGVRLLCVDASAAEIARESAANPRNGASPRGLAYLIYTSGSTGVPKGVAIEHESAVALLSWASGLHKAEELGGMLASTSICFDLSVYELFLPLSTGGRVILADNALALSSLPAAGEVRLINTVPSAIAALLRSGGIPSGVTTVNLAGEPLRTELVDALHASGIQRVHDLYGPSEDTTYSTWTPRLAGAPATIGRPIANTQAYVLDARMRPVPVGVPGELYLGGRGLARGYLGRPVLTAERFLPDPFGGVPGGRLYRTGDRVRWRDESAEVRECVSAGVGPIDAYSRTHALTHSRTHALEFLGRLDAQVKVRGYRVEPGEIETSMRRHAGVRECVVVAREEAPGETRLVAYVAGDADAEALRAHLRRTLPEHMVPAAFVALEALPLTPNGKVDRKALPAPGPAVPEDRYAPPRTPVEEALAGIWAEVLGVPRVGVHDDFFALGGHSLLATRLVWRTREALDGPLTVVALLENPTIGGIAPRLSLHARPAAVAAECASPQHLLAMLDQLSEEELDRLLGADPENQML